MDQNEGVTNVALPQFPDVLRVFFPDGLTQFDANGITRWFTEPTEPDGGDSKFPFCCQMGPPGFTQRKNDPSATDADKRGSSTKTEKVPEL